MELREKNKKLKDCILLFELALVCFIFSISTLDYADYYYDYVEPIREDQMRVPENVSNQYVSKVGDLYYYFDGSGRLVRSKDEGKLQRINDTFYFVDNRGLIYGKYYVDNYFGYKLAKDSYDENISKYIGHELFGDYILKAKTDDGKDTFVDHNVNYKTNYIDEVVENNTIYLGTKDEELTKGIYILGDSYAYYLMKWSDVQCRYSVCPGYALSDIMNELLDVSDFTGIEYCALFIGPNDMLRSTDINIFSKNLEYLIDYFNKRNIKLVFINYFDIPMDIFDGLDRTYDDTVRSICAQKNVAFLDLENLDILYTRVGTEDLIHPPKEFYRPAFIKIIEKINELNK